MYLKKSEALTKWCPFIKMFQGPGPSYNRSADGSKPHECNCIADECMMWRIHPNTADMAGYCGFAGKPDKEKG